MHSHYAHRAGGKLPPGLSRVLGHLRTKFQQLYPCFRDRAVQWCCRRRHRKSRYTGNKYDGRPNRTARNKIPSAIPMFSGPNCSTVMSTMSLEVAGISYSAPTRPHTHVCTFCEKVLRLRLFQSSTTLLNSSTSRTWIWSLEFCF